MEIDNDKNSDINIINRSPKKHFLNENENENENEFDMNENKENEDNSNAQIENSKPEINIKRPRIDIDNSNSDSDFMEDKNDIKNNSEKEEEKKEEKEEEEEIDETEFEKDHEYCLTKLYLRRIVRENHGSPIRQIVFNHQPLPGSDFNASNIVATVAKAGISIYDNEHCGNHFDIMAHFILNGQGYLPGPNGKPPTVEGQMNTMCWVKKIDDAIIATAGEDKVIHILSLSYCKEIAVLTGHEASVQDLISHPINNNIIISSSEDGTIRIWDIYKEKCICKFITDYSLTVIALNNEGNKLIAGTEVGCFIECIIPDWIYDNELYNKKIESEEFPIIFDNNSENQILKNEKFHSNFIDSIGFINDNILSKDINGHICLWELETGKKIREYRNRDLLRINRCRFGISSDNALFCVGTSIGTVLIFDIETGKLISEIGHKRSTEPVKCSIFTQNCKSIIYSNENASIWRYDYVSNKQKKEWENWRHLHPEIKRRNK